MKAVFYVALCFLMHLGAKGQAVDSTFTEHQKIPHAIDNRGDGIIGDPNAQRDTAVSKPDIEARFSQGHDSLMRYIQSNFEYPARCQEEEIKGYVLLRFLVDMQGRVSRIYAVEKTNACPEFEYEATRVLMTTSGLWIPAQLNGKPVRSWRQLPIRFSTE